MEDGIYSKLETRFELSDEVLESVIKSKCGEMTPVQVEAVYCYSVEVMLGYAHPHINTNRCVDGLGSRIGNRYWQYKVCSRIWAWGKGRYVRGMQGLSSLPQPR